MKGRGKNDALQKKENFSFSIVYLFCIVTRDCSGVKEDVIAFQPVKPSRPHSSVLSWFHLAPLEAIPPLSGYG